MILKQFRYWVSVSILGLLVISCTQNRGSSSSSEKEVESFGLDSTSYVVLDFEPEDSRLFEGGRKTTLIETELIEIEEILSNLVEKHNWEETKRLNERNAEYPEDKWEETGYELVLEGKRRQYLPVINESGEKEVWINFFCDDFGAEDWKNQIVEVNDGGNCYFDVKINLTQKTYYDLMVNGYA